MFALAIDGITSLSVKPISILTGTGALLSFLSLIGLILLMRKR